MEYTSAIPGWYMPNASQQAIKAMPVSNSTRKYRIEIGAPQFRQVGHIRAGREGAVARGGEDRHALAGVGVECLERLLHLDGDGLAVVSVRLIAP